MYWLHRSQPAAVNRQHITMTLGHFQKQIVIIPLYMEFKIWHFSCPFFSVSPAENRDSVSESGILVSRAVELTIDEVTLKPAGHSGFGQVGCVLRRPSFRLTSLLSLFSLVVGVKLNVSFWMNSFMNATLKQNVSPVKGWVAAFCLIIFFVIISHLIYFHPI